jgi:hypothetical protein
MTEGQQSKDIIPEGITRTHFLEAMADFDQQGIPPGFKPSHTYDVLYEGRRYPPPAIVALAIKSLTGTLPPPVIRGGKRTRCFEVLRECGFEIVRKKEEAANG